MKVHPFTFLVPDNKSVITERIAINHFYHFLHRHDEWQITWIEESSGNLMAGNNMHNFVPGDVYLIGANLPHLFKNTPDYYEKNSSKIARATTVYFNPKGLLKPLFMLPELRNVKIFLEENPNGFKVPAIYTAPIKQYMIDIHQAENTEVLVNLLAILQNFLAIRAELDPICFPAYSSKISESDGQRLSNIITFIVENYQKQLTLEEVANNAYMTPQAFCRYFKKHTRQTFVAFLNELRINDACKLLITEKKAHSMVGIANKVGFNSITNFNRVFKCVLGKSPKSYINDINNAGGISTTTGY